MIWWCCRFEAADIEEAARSLQGTDAAQASFLWTFVSSAKGAAAKPVVALDALSAILLLSWEEIHAKHPNLQTESAGQKAARRDEQLLQLLLHMHILKKLATDTGVLAFPYTMSCSNAHALALSVLPNLSQTRCIRSLTEFLVLGTHR